MLTHVLRSSMAVWLAHSVSTQCITRVGVQDVLDMSTEDLRSCALAARFPRLVHAFTDMGLEISNGKLFIMRNAPLLQNILARKLTSGGSPERFIHMVTRLACALRACFAAACSAAVHVGAAFLAVGCIFCFSSCTQIAAWPLRSLVVLEVLSRCTMFQEPADVCSAVLHEAAHIPHRW